MRSLCVVFLVSITVLCVTAETLTAAQQQAAIANSGWVYNPIADNKLVASVAGVSTPRMLEQWPALANQGIAQTSFVMNGCALRPVHVHMRATGLLYAIQASNLSVGFITEGGQLVQNYITSGASTIFPVGLLHYQQNLACSPAYYTISYNSEDPGTQVTAPAVMKFPASVANATQSDGTAKPAFIPNSDPECVARCQAAGISVLAPASVLMPPIAAAAPISAAG